MTSSGYPPTNTLHSYAPSKSRLNLPVPSLHNGPDELKRSASTTSTPSSSSPHLYYTPIGPNPLQLSQPNMFSFPKPPHPSGPSRKSIKIEPPEQDLLDKDFNQVFNIGQPDGKRSANGESQARTRSIDTEHPNLIDMGADAVLELPDGNVVDLFDPLTQQSDRPISWPTKLDQTEPKTTTPPFLTPSNETPPIQAKISLTQTPTISPTTYPYPIKLRLKLTAFPEIKPFCQLVQQIRNEHQTNQV